MNSNVYEWYQRKIIMILLLLNNILYIKKKWFNLCQYLFTLAYNSYNINNDAYLGNNILLNEQISDT